MSSFGSGKRFHLSLILLGSAVCGGLIAQTLPQETASSKEGKTQQEVDPLKRQVDEKTRKKQAQQLKSELGKTYKRWLDEDVRWIIQDDEKTAFKQLSNDEERDAFIEQFWARRNPDPDSTENSYKEEHYRRIQYANERFAAGMPGWKTDRGRIYIMYGKPDEIESHPSGGTYDRPPEEGGGSTQTYPFEIWRYRYIDGRDLGQEVMIEFVDDCMCGAYEMTMDRSKKDALLHVPGAGLTYAEQMGQANKADRWNNGMEKLGLGPWNQNMQTKQFDRLAQWAALNRPPELKFPELAEKVTHRIRVNLLPYDVRTDFVWLLGDTVLMPITIQVKNSDVTWAGKEGVQRMVVNIFGRLTTMTGRTAATFEDTVDDRVPDELLPRVKDGSHVYWKALPLKPGRYRLDLALKDVNGDRLGTYSRGILVPEFPDDKLASSTLILADQMEKVPAKNVGAGSFVLGDTKVRPRLESSTGEPAVFKRDQKVNIWMQVYNLGRDPKTNKPSATIEYDIINAQTNQPVVRTVETTEQLGNVGTQVTLAKSLPLASLEPGVYKVTIKIDDKLANQTITPSARFAVR